ncbi:MAG TPA: hypothetical protein VF483_04815 [Gemmatimonadaceae bacterium]
MAAGDSNAFYILPTLQVTTVFSATATGLPSGSSTHYGNSFVGRIVWVSVPAGAPRATATATVTVGDPSGHSRQFSLPVTVRDAPSKTRIAFHWCASETTGSSRAFYYQNEAAPWVTIAPDSSGVISFDATPRVGFASSSSAGNAGETYVWSYAEYLTADELAHTDCGVRTGSKTLNGSVQNGTLRVSAGNSENFLAPKFTLNSLPAVADWVGSGVNAGGAMIGVMRRDVAGVSGDTLPPLDATGAESFLLDTTATSATGCSISFFAGLTVHTIYTPTRVAAIPAALLRPNDLHRITCGSGSTVGMAQVYRTASSVTIAFPSPGTATPAVDTAGAVSYAARRRLVADPNFPDMAGVATYHCTSSGITPHQTCVFGQVLMSKSYGGPVGGTWVLEPPVAYVSGNLFTIFGGATDGMTPIFVAGKPSVYLGGLGSDGDIVRWFKPPNP